MHISPCHVTRHGREMETCALYVSRFNLIETAARLGRQGLAVSHRVLLRPWSGLEREVVVRRASIVSCIVLDSKFDLTLLYCTYILATRASQQMKTTPFPNAHHPRVSMNHQNGLTSRLPRVCSKTEPAPRAAIFEMQDLFRTLLVGLYCAPVPRT